MTKAVIGTFPFWVPFWANGNLKSAERFWTRILLAETQKTEKSIHYVNIVLVTILQHVMFHPVWKRSRDS